MTVKLWSCLRSFTSLKHLSISDSSFSFPSSPSELPSVTKLSAERLTSQSYKGVLSSTPGVRDIDVSIDDAETSNTSQMTTATRPMGQTRAENEQCFVHIRLHPWPARTTDREIDSGESVGGLILLFEDQTKTQQRLHLSGVKGRDEEALVNLFVMTKQLTYLNSGSGGDTPNEQYAVQNAKLQIQHCQLSSEMTEKLWSCLRSFNSLKQLSISDSSLSFPPSPPKLLSVTKLSAERLTSQSYKQVLSSLPKVEDIDVSIDVAETSNTFQIPTASRPMGQTRAREEQFLVYITLDRWPLRTKDRKTDSGESIAIGELSLFFEDRYDNKWQLHVSGMKGRDEEVLVDLLLKTKELTYLNRGKRRGSPLRPKNYAQNARLHVHDCQLSSEMIWNLQRCVGSIRPLEECIESALVTFFLR